HPPPKRLMMMPAPIRAGAVGFLLLAFAALTFLFFSREKSIGRFERWDKRAPVDLQKNVFAYPPEVIGAAWDGVSDQPEVAALLARLIQEGKIKTEEVGSTMQLHLMVPRDTLQSHERALVDALFF